MRTQKTRVLLLILISTVALILPSCRHAPRRMTEIRLGMTKPELVQAIGEPDDVLESESATRGREEIWEYVFKPDAMRNGRAVAVGVLTAEVGFFDDPTEDRHCTFHFVDGRLARWGPRKR